MDKSARKCTELKFITEEGTGSTIRIGSFQQNPICTRTSRKFTSSAKRTAEGVGSESKVDSSSKKTPSSRRGRKSTNVSSVRRKLISDDSMVSPNPTVLVPELYPNESKNKIVKCTEKVKRKLSLVKKIESCPESDEDVFMPSRQKTPRCDSFSTPTRRNATYSTETPNTGNSKYNMRNRKNVANLYKENSDYEISESNEMKGGDDFVFSPIDTPKRKGLSTPKIRKMTPRSKTPTTGSIKQNKVAEYVPQTPYAVRKRYKKEIQTLKFKEEKSEDESVSEMSELDESDDDFDEISSEDSSSERPKISDPTTPRRIKEIDVRKYRDFITLDADHYFEKKIAKKNLSNNKLSSLYESKVSADYMNDIVEKKSVKHKKEVDNLLNQYIEDFSKWLFYLKKGFNLLLYGLGSKQKIMKTFQDKMLNEEYVVTGVGFRTEFTVEKLFAVLMSEVFQTKCPGSTTETITLLNEFLTEEKFPIFVLIHNIDGISLRTSEQQTLLCKLAELPNIHIIASADHINAPLLWGNNKMSSLKFLFMDITTFNPYTVEIDFENPLKTKNVDSETSLKLLNEVYNESLPRSRQILRLFVGKYLENEHKKNFKGILRIELYRWANDEMLIFSMDVLKQHLKTFEDENIIKVVDDYITSSLKTNVLKMFYKQKFDDDDDS